MTRKDIQDLLRFIGDTILGYPVEPKDHILSMAKRMQLIEGCGPYYATEEGIDLYLSVCAKPYYEDDSALSLRFRDEVLSGMDSKGNRTKYDNAALPSTRRQYGPNRAEVDIDRKHMVLAKIEEVAGLLGLDQEKVIQGIKDGSIKQCQNGKPHWGVFHRDHGTFRKICSKCRKVKKRLDKG